MEGPLDNDRHRDRGPVLAVIGVLLLFIGVVAAFLGPLETYCFYLFSEGGRFHYAGFGFGSLMFGNIACQVIGYYLIAIFCIPLGYGHLKVRRWARTLTLASLWFWLVVGLPVLVVGMVMLITSKKPSPSELLIMVPLLVLLYPILPGLLISVYRSRNVRLTFEMKDPKSYWTEQRPTVILVLCLLFLFYMVTLHMLIFFNGMFPLFGLLLFGIYGILLIDASIMCLACLTWGTLKLKPWAWWGSLAYFGFVAFSLILTFSIHSLSDIYPKMNLPTREIEALRQLPSSVQEFHFTVLAAVPLVLTLVVIIFSKRSFRPVAGLRAADAHRLQE